MKSSPGAFVLYLIFIGLCLINRSDAQIDQPYVITLTDGTRHTVHDTAIQALKTDKATTSVESLAQLSCAKKLSLMEARQTLGMTTGPLILEVFLMEIERLDRYANRDALYLELCDGSGAWFDGVDEQDRVHISGMLELASRNAVFLASIDEIQSLQRVSIPYSAWVDPRRMDFLAAEFPENQFNPDEIHSSDVVQKIAWGVPEGVAPGSRVKFSVTATALENLEGKYRFDVFKQWEQGYFVSSLTVAGCVLIREGEFLAPTSPGRYALRIVFADLPRDFTRSDTPYRSSGFHGDYYYKHQNEFALYSKDRLVWAECAFEVKPRPQTLELAAQ
ncbi:hypothetical protein JXA32_16390 [Candidatus Sumerlaeota bacterium]|nr:hypothetical protein [Candidatus Sumerlaeota bacterium]